MMTLQQAQARSSLLSRNSYTAKTTWGKNEKLKKLETGKVCHVREGVCF